MGVKPNKHKLGKVSCQGRIRFFNGGGGAGAGIDDTDRPPNYTLIYFKLSYVCRLSQNIAN